MPFPMINNIRFKPSQKLLGHPQNTSILPSIIPIKPNSNPLSIYIYIHTCMYI